MSIWPKYRLCALTMVRHQYFPTGGVPGIFYASNLVSPSGPARPQRLVAWTGRHALVCLMWPCCHAIGDMADWATPRLTVWPTYRSGHTTSQSPLTHILRPPHTTHRLSTPNLRRCVHPHAAIRLRALPSPIPTPSSLQHCVSAPILIVVDPFALCHRRLPQSVVPQSPPFLA
jgi:hypothetical protein